MLSIDVSRVTYIRNYTTISDVLTRLPLKEQYENFRMKILRTADWSTWHGRLRKCIGLEKGWCINTAYRNDILSVLDQWNIPFVVIDSNSLQKTIKIKRNLLRKKTTYILKEKCTQEDIFGSELGM